MSTQTAVVDTDRDQLDVVIVGHVDHGKSTVIGRLMADTGSLPDGKLEQVKATCERNARPFEYAFLLDALKNEQAQGITIDAARCFFKTEKRDYIINDAPGHIEFLKNMITGAARAEAALLVIDAHEGIQENSKRHGYILSMLGLKQVVVLVNKMDLVDYSQAAFDDIRDTFSEFLGNLGVHPDRFIPVSARDGVNITVSGDTMPWYDGPTVLGQVDLFLSGGTDTVRPFRLPVQDVYKFTEGGDDRRIVAGTIETGRVHPGDEVVFLPSGKRSTVKSVEVFNADTQGVAYAGQATGLTLDTQIYARAGELLVRADQTQPRTTTRFRANLFWMGHAPLVANKRYKLKIGAMRVPVELAEVRNVLDASELTSVSGKGQVDRHDVGEVVLETTRPVALDLAEDLEKTGRFVIVDDYEIAGCGIVLEDLSQDESLFEQRIKSREFQWEKSAISREGRIAGYGHAGKLIVLIGDPERGIHELARRLERKLFASGKHTYYLAVSNMFKDLDGARDALNVTHEEHIIQLGELARVITDSGLLFITNLGDADGEDLRKLRLLNAPSELFVVQVGPRTSDDWTPDVHVEGEDEINDSITKIIAELNEQDVIPDFCI